MIFTYFGIFGLFVLSLFVVRPAYADHGATLLLTPSSGTFVVGSTFDVSLMLDTNHTDANAVAAFLKFPPDKLQIISSSAGKSVVGLWSVPPRFSNQSGTIELQGVITGGLNASNALITTVTFRVHSTGSAAIEIADESRVLKHDGSGSDFLQHHAYSIYTLVLPLPAGPLVVSQTHPDESAWYPTPHISLSWNLPDDGKAEGFSYVFNNEPIAIPDDTPEGTNNSTTYQNVADGTRYFHIKALRNGVWGGVTHFSLHVDTEPPAEFPITISPSTRTRSRQPIVQFTTTDTLSGVNFYEIKLIPLTPSVNGARESQPLFIEAESPFIASIPEGGRYDVIVRALDKAGNYREVVQRLSVRDPILGLFSDEGLEIDGWFVIPWILLGLILAALLALLIYEAKRIHERYAKLQEKKLPVHIRTQLEELHKYRSKYGKMMMVLLCAVLLSLVWESAQAHAQTISANPPLITIVSEHISNEDIFYVGGKTVVPKSEIILYIQNTSTGETTAISIMANEVHEWFYSHNTFLSSGEYIIWAQSKIGEVVSAPSPQVRMHVESSAIQFGSSRISYSTLYLSVILLLGIGIAALGGMITATRRRVRAMHTTLLQETREAEEAVRKGFAVLRRDLQLELAAVQNARGKRDVTSEEEERESQLLKDLEEMEQFIGKEVWDIEALGRRGE